MERHPLRLSRKKAAGRRLYPWDAKFVLPVDTVPPLPPKKGAKADVHKVFILDAQGGYAGEYTMNDDCVVEFGEYMAQVPEGGIADGQTIFLNEWKATTLTGDRMGLVLISRGQLGPEEVTWARAALIAAEAQLVPTEHPEEAPLTGPNPDKAVMENLASALDKREAAVAEREKAVAGAEQRAQGSWEERRKQFEAELEGLRARMARAENDAATAKSQLEEERQRMRAEMERIARTPKAAAGPPVDPKLEALRKQTDTDRKYLQKYALDLIEREKKAQEIELMAEEMTDNLAEARKEVESLRAQLVEARVANAEPTPEFQAQRREVDMRVKILQEKAMDLLSREEKLRTREQKIMELLKSQVA